MKLKIIRIALLLTAALIAPTAHAMTYAATNADTLLVFRKDNFNDVVFGIGTVSNLLALPNGVSTNISYDASLVKANFNDSFDGVKFILLATYASEDPLVLLPFWATDASLTVPATNMAGNAHGIVRSKISGAGNSAVAITGGGAAPFVVSPAQNTSYTYTVTDGTGTSPETFFGGLQFVCEADAGSRQTFWQVLPSNATPKPRAKWVGTVIMNAATGALTYTSGTNIPSTLVASRITGIIRSNGVSRVSFTTTNGSNYRLLSSTNLVTWVTNAAAGTIAGNNATNVLNDTNASGRMFYRIQTF